MRWKYDNWIGLAHPFKRIFMSNRGKSTVCMSKFKALSCQGGLGRGKRSFSNEIHAKCQKGPFLEQNLLRKASKTALLIAHLENS